MPVEIGSGSYEWQRKKEAYRWDKTPGKKRYLPFYENVGAFIASGMTADEAAFEAGKKMGWMSSSHNPLSDDVVRKKALKILQRPDAPAQLGKFFKKAADFDAVDMAQTAVKWIRGEMEHNGEKLPPSEGMLKAVMGAVLPKPVKQVQVDTRMSIMRVGMGQEPPKLAARTLEAIEGEVAD